MSLVLGARSYEATRYPVVRDHAHAHNKKNTQKWACLKYVTVYTVQGMALCHDEARDLHVDEGGQPSPTNNPNSIQRDFDFAERPSQDFLPSLN